MAAQTTSKMLPTMTCNGDESAWGARAAASLRKHLPRPPCLQLKPQKATGGTGLTLSPRRLRELQTVSALPPPRHTRRTQNRGEWGCSFPGRSLSLLV